MKNTFWKKILFVLVAGTLALNASENPTPEIERFQLNHTEKMPDGRPCAEFSFDIEYFKNFPELNSVICERIFFDDAGKNLSLADAAQILVREASCGLPEYFRKHPEYEFAYEYDFTAKFCAPVRNRISLFASLYHYTGGNHGETRIHCLNFDLGTRKQIFLKDLFKEDFESKLGALLVDNDPRREQADFAYAEDDDFPGIPCAPFPTEDFLILPDGLEFIYSPYDIDCYAAGTIRVFVPYSALKDLLKD